MHRRIHRVPSLSTLLLAAIAAGCASAGDPGLSSDSSFDTGGTDGPDDPGSATDTDTPEPEPDTDASTSGPPEEPDPTGGQTDGNDACGDGIVDPDEACDDGTDGGTYGHCLADCSGMGPQCGDGMLDPQEACDDGNTEDDDMCSADCQVPGPAVWAVHFDGSWHQSVEEAAGLVWQDDTLYVAVNERDLIGSSRTHVVTLDSDGTILEDHIQAPAAHELHAAAPKPGDGIIAVGSIGGDAGSQVEIGGPFNANTTASWPDVTAWTDVAVDPSTANQAFLGTTTEGWRMTLVSGGLTDSIDTWVPIYATDFFSDGDLVVAGVGSLGAPMFARNTTGLDAIDQYTHDVASGTLWTVHDIHVGPSDTVYAVGEMHPNDQEGSTRGFIIVLSPELERIWSTLEVSGSRSVWRSVDVSETGNVVVAGNYDLAHAGRVRKLDDEGNPVWTEDLLDLELQLTAVALDENGSPYVAGHTTTAPTDGPADVVITRLVP